MSWDAPVEVIPGVGPRQGERLGRLGVRMLSDLIQLSPRRHEDRRIINPLAQAVDGAPVVFRAVVGDVESRRIRRGLYLVKVSVDDGSGADASLVFFNLPSLSGRFRGLAGSEILGYGTVRRRGKRVDVSAPEWEPVGDEDGAGGDFGKLVPVYPLVEGLTQQRMRSWVRWALERVLPSLPDAVPADLLDKRAWAGIADALVQFHFPDSPDQNARARRRLAYEELLGTLLLLERARAAARPGASCSMPGWRAAVDGFWSRFPYPPTGAQRRASEEIGADLGGGRPMQRLLQGDVGSGKTAVAMAARVVAAQPGFQRAVMAPTA
ncbi:MAG: DNA helicase RecG, partial [Armatimonadaceae bacterium]